MGRPGGGVASYPPGVWTGGKPGARPPQSRSSNAHHRLPRFFQRLIRIEQDVELRGLPDPVIWAFNHNNYYETIPIAFFLARLHGRNVTFLVDWMFGKLPVIGWLVNRLEPVLIYNKKARFNYLNHQKQSSTRRAPLEECLQKLQNNVSIGIFPEGSRNPAPYTLRRGRQGVGELALRAKVPVVPVGVDFPARHRRGRVPAFGRLILRLGRPLTFPVEQAVVENLLGDHESPARLKKKIQRFLAARITHTVMLELSRLAGKTYPFAAPAVPAEARAYLLCQRGCHGTNSSV